MPSVLSQLLRRPPGSGWLILSGGSPTDDHIQRILALVEQAGNAVAVVPTSDFLSSAEEALEPWRVLSGWGGKAVDCGSSELVEEATSEAALILLPDLGTPGTVVEELGQTDAGEFLLAALDGGAVVVAAGLAAEAMGELIDGSTADILPIPPGGDSVNRTGSPGLGWIPGAIIQSHFSAQTTAPVAFQRKDMFRLGLPEGVSIALGPEDEREIWGDVKPTITFRDWWNA
jgi:hypothetical protein